MMLEGLMPAISECDRNNRPYWPPANLLADFAGGAMSAAFAIASALYQRAYNGNKGCVIDCSMVEGLAYMGTFAYLHKDNELLWGHEYSIFSGNCPIYR